MYRARIYDVFVDAFGGIASLVVGDDALMPNVRHYEAIFVDHITTESETFVLDPGTAQLVPPRLLAQRDAWRNELLLAEQREKEAEAERRWILAEIEKKDREDRERIAAERAIQIERYAKLHIVWNDGLLTPAPGYGWVDEKDEKSEAVEWIGNPPENSHAYAGSGSQQPGTGFLSWLGSGLSKLGAVIKENVAPIVGIGLAAGAAYLASGSGQRGPGWPDTSDLNPATKCTRDDGCPGFVQADSPSLGMCRCGHSVRYHQ